MTELTYLQKAISKSNLWWFTSCCLLVGLAFFGVFKAPLGDFGNYYFGSKLLYHGLFDACIYEPACFNSLVQNFIGRPVFLNYTPVPPITALFYIPFTFLPPVLAKMVFNLVGAAALWAASYRISKRLEIASFYVFIGLVLMLFPLKSNFDQGQTYALVISALMFGFLLLEKHKNITALLWSSAALLKIFPAVAFVYLLFKRDYKALFWAVALSAVLVSASVALIDSQIWKTYLLEILPRLFKGEINNPFSSSYQSTTVFLKQLFVEDALLNPNPLIHAPRLFVLLDGLVKLLMVYVFANWVLAEQKAFGQFAIILFAGLLLTGYGSTYGLLLAFPLVLFFISKRHSTSVLMLVLLGLSFSSQVFEKIPFLQNFPFFRLLGFILVLLLVLKPTSYSIHLKWLLIPVSLFAIWALIMPIEQAVGTLLVTNQPKLLNERFEVNDREISMVSFNGKYSEKKLVLLHPASFGQLDFETIDHQIFWKGIQITPARFWATSPVLLEDSLILFLSDEQRGVGFYAPRIMSLKKHQKSKE